MHIKCYKIFDIVSIVMKSLKSNQMYQNPENHVNCYQINEIVAKVLIILNVENQIECCQIFRTQSNVLKFVES